MRENGEVIYSTTFEPDPHRALDVLAFLLVPAELFFEAGDAPETRRATTELLDNAKRDALTTWYAHHIKR